ncbi:methyltransferase domain-containing protein [Sphaerisporangium sp. NPDC049002]|uniref:methyltransferase domain-containing protein n=1 Tax=unclassified Sphaerisporangium TaxID=2630420 RepID=UPI0033F4AF74
MLRHSCLYEGADILDVATGSGYSAALLSHRFGCDRITSIDVDPYLTEVAAERLGLLGLHPTVLTRDATGVLPGSYDRILSMVSVPRIPPSWIQALRPGGRLVTPIRGMAVIVAANKLSSPEEQRVSITRPVRSPPAGPLTKLTEGPAMSPPVSPTRSIQRACFLIWTSSSRKRPRVRRRSA